MKLLYMMHIPWKWIKQRPHYIAEMLNDVYDTTVICKEPFKFKRGQHIIGDENRIANKFYAIPFYKLPFLDRMPFLRKINHLLIKRQTGKLDHNVVFITSWTLYYFIKEMLNDSTILVYDVMDDDVEFPFLKNDTRSLKFFYETEKKLIERANIVFSSSQYLKDKILQRTSTDKNITVINNAYSPIQNFTALDCAVKNSLSELKNIVMYIGVISSWFDFLAIKALLEANEDVNVVLFGPLETDLFQHPRLHYLGVLKRDAIFEAMSYAEILIMPFIVNELIKSVNPVKVYEYIATDKHIIVSRYEETTKFKDFVNFYVNSDELISQVNSLLKSSPLDNDTLIKRENYLSQNRWEDRFKIVRNLIDSEIC